MIIIVSGTLGNLCVIITIFREQNLRQLQHYVLVASLAVSDFLFNSVIMPFYVDTWWHNSDRHGATTCYYYNFLGTVLLQMSGTIIAFIALNRYLLITHIKLFRKFENYKATMMQLLLAIGISVATLSPSFTDIHKKITFQEKIARCNFHRIAARPVILAVFIYCVIVPSALIFTFYILILIKLKKTRQTIKQAKGRCSTDLELETIFAIAHGLPASSIHPANPQTDQSEESIVQNDSMTPVVKYYETKSLMWLYEPKSRPTALSKSVEKNPLSKRRMTDDTQRQQANLKAFLPIVAIFVTYILTYIPFTVINMMDSDYELAREYYMISNLFFWASSCLNPWIYGLMNKELNSALKRLLKAFIDRLCCLL